ncbi:zinc ribbon domain-containing protein [Virgisporangium ochraceum]|uniref:zinc ribbon domain-containing protein n=1 Tax=Virgisporangium ochraceum TaxID=65505 RepID=UPI0019452193|nr:zinc ribbon domain-containing protein [Virgisporangium ochraceum]
MASRCPRCGRPVASSARRCPSCDKVLRSPVDLATPRPTELPAVTRPKPPRSTAEIRTEAAVERTRAGVRTGMRFWRWLPRRAKFVLAGVVAVLVIGVPAAIWVVGKVAYAPEEPVEDLVAAFEDRDYARVAELAGCTARLCRSGVLGEGYTPPSDLEIAEVAMGGSTSPDTADVVLRYQLAGERRESIIRVRRESGVLPKSWSIRSGVVGSLEIVAPTVKSARVAGLQVDPSAGGRESALIGTYTVRVGDDPLYESAPIDATVAGDLRTSRSTSVDVRTTVKQSARDEVATQVRAFLEGCAGQDAVKPKVNDRPCPFSARQPQAFSTDFAWKLDPAPEFEVVVPDRPREGVVLEVRTTKPGSAVFSYTAQNQPFQYDPVPVSVKGDVYLTDGKIQFFAT